jgi:hypothetical protein
MHNTKRSFIRRSAALLTLACMIALPTASVVALGAPDPTQNTSTGLEASISAPAPTQAASIVSPSQGQTFSETPITVAGSCKAGLLVKIFSNNVFVGSTICTGGSYSLKVDLFSGRNDLVARVYDSLDQAGPESNLVSVNFNDAQFAQFGTRVSLSSSYARKGANPGTDLVWPLVLSGGKGPYAVSVNWGDTTESTLYSESFPGTLNVSHIYQTAGVYNIVVKATDGNGTTAYLQLVGVANGEVGSGTTKASDEGGAVTVNPESSFMSKFGWYIVLAMFPLMFLVFWLGSRHELFVIRRRIERSRQQA